MALAIGYWLVQFQWYENEKVLSSSIQPLKDQGLFSAKKHSEFFFFTYNCRILHLTNMIMCGSLLKKNREHRLQDICF